MKEERANVTEKQGKVVKAAGVMVLATLASRILGQLRESAIATWFGQNATTDIYKAAFKLPDLMFYLIAGGALSAAFIPVFTQYIKEEREDEAWVVFSTVATFLALAMAVFVAAGEIFARPLVALLAPGFSAEPWKLDATAHLTRIILPSQFCFMLGALLMATLYVRGKFLVPALGPIIYNLCILVLGALLHRRLGTAGLCWGVLLGAFTGNFLLQALFAARAGVRYRPMLRLRHPGVVKVGKLALPVILGLSLPQTFSFINTMFASLLAGGTITALDNANKLMQIPLGIFGQAISIAVFPAMSMLAARGEMDGFRRTFMQGTRAMWFITLPISLLMIVVAPEFVSLILGWGKFTAENTRITAIALGVYSAGLFAFSCQSILNRAFFALHDTLAPMIIGTLTTVIFVGLNFLLIRRFDYVGLAAAGSLAAVINMAWMLIALRRKVAYPARVLAGGVARITLAAAGAMAVGYGARWALARAIPAFDPHHAKLAAMVMIAVVMTAGGAAYLVLARLLHCEEMDYALGMLLRRRRVK